MKQLLLFFFIYLVSYFSYGQDFIVTDGLVDNTCSGVLYAAAPGTSLPANQNLTYTICSSEDSGSRVFLDFQSFNLSYPGVSLVIHDGLDTGTPVIFSSVGLVTGDLALVLAGGANATGCLTLVVTTPSFIPPSVNLNFSALIGCEAPCQNIFQEVEITGNACFSSTSVGQIYQVNESILFNGFATFENDFDAELISYNWVINDVSYDDQQQVEITFENPGTYNGSLIVSDQFGCTSEPSNFNFEVADQQLFLSEVNTSYTLEQLISEVLISGENCANISNISSPQNASVSGENFESIGYFNKGCSDFPFDEGLVIGSGSIANIISPGASTGGFSWLGVDELTILGGGTPDSGPQSRNATLIEFDFSSFENEVSFNYFFASYEYPTFVCSFADVFAFVVSGPYDDEGNLLAGSPLFPEGMPGVYSDVNIYNVNGNPATTNDIDLGGLNVATIPDENGVPVPTTPTNIHNNFECSEGSLGEFFYPEFFAGFLSDLPNPYFNLSGQTEILTAEFQVIPCMRYKMRLMIADWADAAFDSYVFIEAGSFTIGADLGEDISANDLNSVCYGEEINLSVFEGLISNACEVNLNWLQDGESIPNSNDLASISVTEPGLYSLFIGGEYGCGEEFSVFVDFYPVPAYIDNESESIYPNLFNCFNEFDLTVNEPIGLEIFQHNGVGQSISTDISSVEELGMEILYFDNLDNATNNINPLLNPESYQIPGNSSSTTIYARVHESGTGQQLCEDIKAFEVIIAPLEIETPLEINTCPSPNSTFGIFDLTQNNEVVLAGLFSNFYMVDYFESEEEANLYEGVIESPTQYQAIATDQQIWVRVSNILFVECFDVGSFQLVLLSEEDQACDNLSTTNFATGLNIYPNPTKTILSIENLTNTAIKSVNIYTLNGKKVGEYILNSPAQITTSINVSELGNALYLIEIISPENEKYISKFLKY